MLAEIDETWEIVEEVATGRLMRHDTTVTETTAGNPLLMTAVERVSP
jgi:hypothetical protein